MPQIFGEPDRLWLLVGLGIAALLVARGSWRRRAEWHALGFANDPPPSGLWPWWLAAGCAILALAGPRWGREPGTEPRPGHDVVLLVDVSRSMGAEDAVPDRLGLATAAARSLVAQLRAEPGDRAAVVAFAGQGVVRCPLTEDLATVDDRLAELRPGTVEPGGTDLGAGLTTALDVFDSLKPAEGRSVVVFSDGEDHAESWPATIGRFVEAEVPIHVVAVGDPDKPVPVPERVAAFKSGRPAPNPAPAPHPTMTRRTDRALTQLAHATGGASIPLGLAPGDLGPLYRDAIRPMTRGQHPGPRFSERAERYAVCLSAALGASVWGSWPTSRRRRFLYGRIRDRRGRAGLRWVVLTLIALALVLASLAATPPTPDSEAAQAVSRGLQAYRSANYPSALAAFEAATGRAPANPVGPFGAGSALFALGRYAEAGERYDSARTLAAATGHLVFTAKVDYALGNCAAMMGEFATAVGHYDSCLATLDGHDELATVHHDAAVNRAFVLTQITPPAASPDRPDGDRDRSDPPPESPDRKGSRQKGRSPQSPDPDPTQPGGSGSDPAGSRGPGGAGGGGVAPPREGSPDRRLDAALQRIKAAREQQPTEPPPPASPPGPDAAGKDW